jgi:hypothetical protein
MAYKIFNPAASDGKEFFQHLPEKKIHFIELTPLDRSSPIKHSLSINDRYEVSRFIAIWGGVDTFVANHPKDAWAIGVKFHTDKGIYSGVLRATINQGMMFDFNKSPTGWPVISEYQFKKSQAQIEAILKSIKGS